MKILLVCAGGFSSSLVARRVQQAASERKLDVSVEFGFPPFIDRRDDVLVEYLRRFDVLLIAPQIRFMVAAAEKRLGDVGIPYALIDSLAYGQCDGDKILDQALALYGISLT
ncbi:MAG TPA: PTS sugar transporter subunit IIB [Symbiobacteriaceae bacterium]|nr:PTS sugar transporter subunit IIB [Symbiobacteriaceae bacterium]